MRLLKRLGWRLVSGLGVLWGTATLIFIVLNVTPGDTAMTILGGPEALPTPAVLAQVRHEYALDRPLPEQYLLYLSHLAQGDLGESYRLHVPVAQAIGQQLGATAMLTVCAAVVSVLLSLATAILTAHRARWISSIASSVELTISATPSFIVGVVLLLAFSYSLRMFPVSGTHGWTAILLPTLTLALPIIGALTQVLRREFQDIMEQPFITTARARGMSDTGVRLGHVLRHALIPTVTLSAAMFSVLFSSAVVVETVFNRQGIGRLMVDATTTRDVPLVTGIALLATLVTVLINITVDIIYTIIDPRVEAA